MALHREHVDIVQGVVNQGVTRKLHSDIADLEGIHRAVEGGEVKRFGSNQLLSKPKRLPKTGVKSPSLPVNVESDISSSC